ncbi:MAG: glycosyltransferase family 39 protein [Actinomycetota bacterium]|nr:glycosyltransferase family 39 protein [Actinomycetota bacterium]
MTRRALAAAAVLFGLGLRVHMLRSGWGVLDSDEAIMGLMARAAQRGDFSAFLWGQQYGGAAEAYVIAFVFLFTGATTAGIRIATLALAATAAVLTWRVGKRLLGPHAGAAAGLAVWLWPTAGVFLSFRNRGFYWITIVAGLVFVLASLRLAERPNRRDAVVAGLAAGLGWWSTPQIVTFVVPVAVWVLLRARHLLRPLALFGLPAAVVGAAPWVFVNLRDGLVSLTPPPLPPGAAGTYASRLDVFVDRGLPMALGLRIPWSEQWVPHGEWLYVVVLVALIGGLAWRRAPLVVWVGLLVFPFVHPLSPLSNYVGEGRYFVYYVPFLTLALAAAVRHRIALALLVVVLAGSTVYAVDKIKPVQDDYAPLIEDLDRRGIRAAYADYWIGYRLMFESEERIVVGIMSPDASRNLAFDQRVDAAARHAYVTLTDSLLTHLARTDFTRFGVAWEEYDIAQFTVLIPERPVRAADLAY